ncbi:MAG: hypothetical protein PVJ43_13760 [Gemmatimonadales bacterium]|jgi:hypothetical protein
MTPSRICRPPVRLIASVVIAFLGVACGGGGDDAGQVEVDTLESGTIVVRNGAAGVWATGEGWRAVELVRIGSEDSTDPVVLFADVWDVTLDAFGRIYVLDRQPKEVRVFDPSGVHVRTQGGEGGGPGELRNPIGLAWGPAGNLWVVDQQNARYTVFDTAGNYVRSVRREIGGWGYPWGGGFDEAGHLYEPSYFRERTTGASRRAYLRHAVGDGVTARDTFDLPEYADSESQYRIEVEGGITVVSVPFAPQLRWRFDGSDGIWFGVNDSYRLYHRGLNGDTLRIVEKRVDPIPVGESDLDAVRDRFAEFGEPVVNAIIARTPDAKPAFEDLVVDDRGYLWVIRTSATHSDRSVRDITFDVFDPEGVYLGAVKVDVGRYPPPRIIGDHLVGVVRDEFDTPYVVLHRIEGRRTF